MGDLFPTYATEADYAAYTGTVSEYSELTFLLSRANELVKMCTRNNIVSTNEDHMALAKLAACAQVKHWIDSGESAVDGSGRIASYSLGKLSVTMAAQADVDKRSLCSVARAYLEHGYLLYSGMRW